MTSTRQPGQVILCLLFFLLLLPTSALGADVVVVKSKNLSVYDKAIEGFRSVYKGGLATLVMADDLSDPDDLVSAVRGKSPKVILAVGLGAAKVLTSRVTDIPIVFCMAMNPKQSKLHTDNATGVDLEPRPREQLAAFKKALPGVRRIGVIYDAKRTGAFISAAGKASGEVGVGLVAIKVHEKKDVPAALKKLIKHVDALWLIRDATVMSREFFKQTLIIQFDKKIPLLAYSPMFVAQQAVCSFASSYSDQGKKAAEITNSIIGGASPGDIPIQAPVGTLTVNPNSASKAGVEIPASVLSNPGVNKVGK